MIGQMLRSFLADRLDDGVPIEPPDTGMEGPKFATPKRKASLLMPLKTPKFQKIALIAPRFRKVDHIADRRRWRDREDKRRKENQVK